LDPARRSAWVARRRLRQRYRAGLELLEAPARPAPEYASPAFDRLPAGNGLVEVGPAELSAELLRAAIVRSGCLLVRGLLDETDAARLVEGIDRAHAARAAPDPGAPLDPTSTTRRGGRGRTRAPGTRTAPFWARCVRSTCGWRSRGAATRPRASTSSRAASTTSSPPEPKAPPSTGRCRMRWPRRRRGRRG